MCHSRETVTSTTIVPNAMLSMNGNNVTQRPYTKQIELITTPSTVSTGDMESVTITTPSILDTMKILASTKRPPNIKLLATNSTGINAGKNVSSIPTADKANVGGRLVKPKNKQQMYEQKQQQKQQHQQKQSQSKVSSWPSKPTGTHLEYMEGNFSFAENFFVIVVADVASSISFIYIFFLHPSWNTNIRLARQLYSVCHICVRLFHISIYFPFYRYICHNF